MQSFAFPKVFQGYSHRTSFGFPFFQVNEGSIALQSKPINTTNKAATQYAIRYPFKQGFTYQVRLYGKSGPIGSGSLLPIAGIRWSNDSAGTNTSQNCNGPVSRPASFNQSYGTIAFTTGFSWSGNLINGVASENFTYLLVSGAPAEGVNNPNVVSLTFIQKIEITETPPPANFSITPSSTNITCGTANPQTFTINNLNNTPNITNHTWNLGNNNGWLFNGNPASATISTGTTNTLTLTPDCGKALSNVSATVTAGATNYNTNTATVSISQPTYSISGNSNICSGSTNYSINGLVCNSSVEWTAPPSNLATLSNFNTSSTTLTATGNSGDFTLTANVTSCGVTNQVTLPVKVGVFTASDYTLTGGGSSTQPLLWCSGRSYSFYLSGPGNFSNVNWTVPTGWTMNYNGGSYCVMRAPSGSTPPSDVVAVSFTEPCGTTITKTFQTGFSTSACTGSDPRFNFSPNPAPTFLNVSVASGFTGTVFIRRVQIIRIATGTTMFDQSYGSGISNTTISTSSYPFGTYSLRIFDGTIWATYQFSK